MKRAIWAMTFGVLILAAGWAQAQEFQVGVVDVRKVLTESKAGKKFKAEMDKTLKQRQDSLDREEKKLKDMQAAYEKDKLVLSDKQKQAKEKEFNEKARAFQKSAAEAQREFQQKEQEFMTKTVPPIQVIAGELAKEQKLAVVFEKSMPSLVYANARDLTEDVIKRFDARAN